MGVDEGAANTVRAGDAGSPVFDVEGPCGEIVLGANEGIWILDLNGATVFANPKMAEFVGRTSNEMAVSSVFDFLNEEGRAQASEVFRRERLEQGTRDRVECLFLRMDGSSMWASVSHSPWRDSGGRQLGLLCVVSDITDRKRIDEALRRREEQLAEAQRVAHLGSWEWEIGPDTITWSAEMYRIFGLDPEAFPATYDAYMSKVHPDDRAVTEAGVSGCLNGEPTFEFDSRILRPSGEMLWIHVIGEMVRDKMGDPLLLRGTTLDVTAYKEAEEALRRTSAGYRLLQRMATAANESSNFNEMLQLAVDQLCEHTGWPVGRVYLVTGGASELVPTPLWHVSDEAWLASVEGAMSVDSVPSRRSAARVLAEGKPAWKPGVADGISPRGTQHTMGSTLWRALLFPCWHEGRSSLFWSSGGKAWYGRSTGWLRTALR